MVSVVYQVRWAMYEECCAADVSEGREFQSWKLGTGMEDGETKERGRGEGAKYAACDTETYEKRCALEVGEEETRAVKAAKREEGQERVDARESERWTVEEEVSVVAIPGRIVNGEMMVTRYVQVVGGWAPVDAKTEVRHFREAGVGCVEHEGWFYIETRNVNEVGEGGARLLETVVGFGWSPVDAKTVGDFCVCGSRCWTTVWGRAVGGGVWARVERVVS